MTRPAIIEAPAASLQPSRPVFARATGRAFRAAQQDGITTIDLFDEIGIWGTSLKDFKEQLPASGDVLLRINSPGGDVFDGLGVFNLLVGHDGKVDVEIVGLAASIASIIAMAGDSVAIADNAFFMVHRAWTWAIGNEAELADTAGLLRQIDGSLAATYAAKTGQSLQAVNALMRDETWLTASEAVDLGFADRTIEGRQAKAAFDLSVYANAPKEISAEINRDEMNIRDLEALLREAGFSRSKARAIASRGITGITDDQRDAAEIAELVACFEAAASTIH